MEYPGKEYPAVAVIGAGKVGSALAILLCKQGYRIAGVASRTFNNAAKLAARVNCSAFENCVQAVGEADLILVTTPDREISSASTEIASGGGYRPGQVVVHTSGAHPSSELRGVREAGALALSMHPLQSFAEVQGAMENLPGSCFALEGDADAVKLGEKIVGDLKGKSFVIEARDKPLYHAAACVASNYLVSVLHLATGLYQNFGLSREQALEALFPLIRGTVDNIRRSGPVQALTGPVARGDISTVEGHLRAMKNINMREKELYKQLGSYTAIIAQEKGTIDSKQEKILQNIFKGDAFNE